MQQFFYRHACTFKKLLRPAPSGELANSRFRAGRPSIESSYNVLSIRKIEESDNGGVHDCKRYVLFPEKSQPKAHTWDQVDRKNSCPLSVVSDSQRFAILSD